MLWRGALVVAVGPAAACSSSPGTAEATGSDASAKDGAVKDAGRETASAKADATPRACIPGASVACACTNGATGAQVCDSDGQGYGSCTGCSTLDATTTGKDAKPDTSSMGDATDAPTSKDAKPDTSSTEDATDAPPSKDAKPDTSSTEDATDAPTSKDAKPDTSSTEDAASDAGHDAGHDAGTGPNLMNNPDYWSLPAGSPADGATLVQSFGDVCVKTTSATAEYQAALTWTYPTNAIKLTPGATYTLSYTLSMTIPGELSVNVASPGGIEWGTDDEATTAAMPIAHTFTATAVGGDAFSLEVSFDFNGGTFENNEFCLSSVSLVQDF